MSENKLNVVAVENSKDKIPANNKLQSPSARREEAQAQFERLWLTNPEKFNPLKDCMGRERIHRSWKAIKAALDVSEKRATDLGCGYGVLTLKLRDAGASVDAVDIASIALRHLQEHHDMRAIRPIQDWVPKTRLKDDDYDLVLSTDLIGYLHPADFRLFFSELARLVKSDGTVICSTLVDIHSEDSLERFKELAETELAIKELVYSYHSLYIRICDFFDAPRHFYKASKDPEYRFRQLSKRRGLRQTWFKYNSTMVLGAFWGIINLIAEPVAKVLHSSKNLMLFLERICRFLWDKAGISHVILVGKRKPLVVPSPTPILGKERTRKWE